MEGIFQNDTKSSPCSFLVLSCTDVPLPSVRMAVKRYDKVKQVWVLLTERTPAAGPQGCTVPGSIIEHPSSWIPVRVKSLRVVQSCSLSSVFLAMKWG